MLSCSFSSMWHFSLSFVREKFAEGEKARKIDKKNGD
jgi:hypothetical protein